MNIFKCQKYILVYSDLDIYTYRLLNWLTAKFNIQAILSCPKCLYSNNNMQKPYFQMQRNIYLCRVTLI